MSTPTPPTNPRGEPVPPDETGYAVGKDQLRVEEDRDRFEIDLSAEEATVLRKAVRNANDTTDSIVESVHHNTPTQMGMKGSTFRGDKPALEAAIKALRGYERHEASIGEDKIAHDARTALNHAQVAVKKRLGE